LSARLTILQVAYPFAPVASEAAGGAEQILARLDQALIAEGHNSIVIAYEGSRVQGELIETALPSGELNDAARAACWRNHRQAIARALAEFEIDLVHLHGVDFYEYLPPGEAPVLVTLHLPIAFYPQHALTATRPNTFFNCVSLSQQRDCPAGVSLALSPVSNGVSWADRALARYERRGYVAAMGRICPEKGFHLALDAASRAKVPMLLAGKVFAYPEHLRYFEQEIASRLSTKRRFIGAVGPHAKLRLLSSARCVLIPSLVAETSSLVAMEAAACGTPVVAFPSGALSELVEHGTTGFLVSDAKEMADAIEACRQIDPEACRSIARAHFSALYMASRYLALYRLLSRKQGELTHAA
jgi:glycosyltransferase involved in cell wall biosynthesis